MLILSLSGESMYTCRRLLDAKTMHVSSPTNTIRDVHGACGFGAEVKGSKIATVGQGVKLRVY